MTERIQKILSQWGIASRRKAEKMILAGRVKLNGQIAVLGDKADLAKDQLEVDNQLIQKIDRPTLVYILINKPLGVVSTCSDPQGRPTVIDLLPKNLNQNQGIHPVGRLDFYSTGALILTNDGNLTLNLTHPRYHLPKTYHVWLDNHPTKHDLELWREGIMLDKRKTLPAKVKVIRQKQHKTLLEIVLVEGRNRQIRRIAEKLGFKVISLHRIAIGSITLSSNSGTSLPQGAYRHLTSDEVTFLNQSFNAKFSTVTAPYQKAVLETQ